MTHEAVSVLPENPLEISPIARPSNSLFRDFESYLIWWKGTNNAKVVSYLNKKGELLRDVSKGLTSNGFLQSQNNFPEDYPILNVIVFHTGQNHSTRMVSSSQNFSDDLPDLAQTNGRHVFNQNEQQATSVFLSNSLLLLAGES